MVPNASEITRRRVTAATVLRLIAVFVSLFAMIPIIALGVQIAEGGFRWRFNRFGPFIIAAAIILTTTFVLWILTPWITRLMIRVPRVAVCPNCRFKLEGLMTPRCNECGYTLTAEFLTTAAERAGGVREPDTIWLRQICALICRLVGGAFLPAAAIGSFVTAYEAIREPRWNDWLPVFLWAGSGVFALGVLIFATTISILFVPGRQRFGAFRPAIGPALGPVPDPAANPHADPAEELAQVRAGDEP